MKVLPEELAALRTVVAAVVDGEGVLLEANAGFLRLLPPPCAAAPNPRVGRFFVQPSFRDLLRSTRDTGGAGYGGLMTLGDMAGVTRTLKGAVTARGEGFRMLAEYDIDEIERIGEAILSLHSDATRAQRQVTGDYAALRGNEARIVEASLTDPLTGLGNRRKMDQALAAELARAGRDGSRLSVVMADVDHFKRVNDEYGHPAGDQVLVRVGRLFRDRTRITDTAARFGGEEFVLLLVGAGLEQAVAKAEQLRTALELEPIEPLSRPVTASFGVAEWAAGEDGASLLARADAALYEAKRTGRNRVCTGPASG